MPDARYQIEAEIERSLARLQSWVEGYGFEGWDPYDIKGKRAFRRIQAIPLVSPFLRLFVFACPLGSRSLFRVRKTAYPEAMAAFTNAYLNLHKLSGARKHLDAAVSCLGWLERNSCGSYSEFCWGAAFDWDYEGILIPKGTPDSTATSMAARAFFDAYRELGEERYLKIAESACRFILKGLNIDWVDENTICFSYTPLDSTHVHNANLFDAAVLALVGEETGERELVDFATKALNYTLGEQNSDGSWYYRGPPDQGGRLVDNYHTGFVLRNVCYLRRVLGEEEIERSLLAGYEYYRKNLFLDPTPKLTPDRLYPVDIYSCAEAILCLTTLSELFPQALDEAKGTAKWTIEHMQDRKGHFYYRKYRLFTQRFPFIRWGQAIMLEALSSLLRLLKAG